jgi:hypothetical protein
MRMRTTARQLVYDYRHTAYRGYGWAFSGVNLRPDNPTPDKLAVYEQRQRELIPPIGKELALAMLPGGIQRGAGLAGARYSRLAGHAALPEIHGPRRVLVGVEMDPRLGTPAGGWDYEPHVVHGARSEAAAYSHYIGYQAELRLANEVVATNKVVLKYGDPIGRHGADFVSVDPNSGAVTLWDSKCRARGGTLEQSPTITGSGPLNGALDEAKRLIPNAPHLSAQVKQRALENLESRNFTANTVGSGGLKNSVQVRYCNGTPC